jgi:hypothetical protein
LLTASSRLSLLQVRRAADLRSLLRLILTRMAASLGGLVQRRRVRLSEGALGLVILVCRCLGRRIRTRKRCGGGAGVIDSRRREPTRVVTHEPRRYQTSTNAQSGSNFTCLSSSVPMIPLELQALLLVLCSSSFRLPHLLSEPLCVRNALRGCSLSRDRAPSSCG